MIVPSAARAGRLGLASPLASARAGSLQQQQLRRFGASTAATASPSSSAPSASLFRRRRHRLSFALLRPAAASGAASPSGPSPPRPPAPPSASATAEAPTAADASLPPGSVPLLRKSYPLRGGHRVSVTVFRAPTGDQAVVLRTDVPAAAPLLHWGVEGGRDYKGGWRLPGGGARPPGTRQYKDRALQTPFGAAAASGGTGGGESGGGAGADVHSLTLVLAGDEASDALNFVVKDDATDTWWDHNGANFRVPLRLELATASMLDGGDGGGSGASTGAVAAAVSAAAAAAIAASAKTAAPQRPPSPGGEGALDDESDLPQLTDQLCDTWAWVRWDHAGRPQRSAALADEDYSRAVGEMTALLRAGRPLEELWRVARGETPYAAYKVDVVDKTLGQEGGAAGGGARGGAGGGVSAPAVAPRPADGSRVEGPPVTIPEDLVAVQAYLLWEKAGKPQGADFGSAARQEIEAQMRQGLSLAELDARLRGGKEPEGQRERRREEEARQKREVEEGERRERERRDKQAQQQAQAQQQQQQQQQKEEAKRAPPAPAAAAPAPAAAPVFIGESRGLGAARDPLALIKPKSPTPGAGPSSASAPSLSEDKHRKQGRPLDPVVQAAALDPATRWRRTFQLGSKAQLLAVVKQRRARQRDGKGEEEADGDMVVTLITDAADELVLHWGASPAGAPRKWARPPAAIRPDETVETATGEACETAFASCGRPGDRDGEGGCRVDFSLDDTIDEESGAGVGGAGGAGSGGDGERTDDGGNETLGRAFLRASSKVPLQRVAVRVPASSGLCGLTFVLRSADGTRWHNDAGGGNFFVPLPFRSHAADGGAAPPPDDAALAAASAGLRTSLERAVVDAEVNSSAWTLMHRYNRAAELLGAALDGGIDIAAPAAPAPAVAAFANAHANGNGNGGAHDMLPALEGDQAVAQACADIYVWLRYSATRQLTWQRNYNTQPRILSAAQERLTRAVAAAHGQTRGEAQEWCRAALTTVGRGGDGQRIRDEILHIMHRNHISEVKGTWMEEWHQKLHNNTTPDDVPICQAYLAFLEADGDRAAYWRVLSDNGVTRERLESFDRPVRCEPEWFGPGKKDALVRDFRGYLGILKAVHSGADLQASAAAVSGGALPEGARPHLGYVLSHIGDAQVLPFVEAAVEARAELAAADGGRRLAADRDLLYLDLALEGAVRAAAERGVGGGGGSGGAAAALMAPLLQNLALTLGDNEEVAYCLKAWQALPAGVRLGGGARASRDEALLAVAVAGRVRRAVAAASDAVVARVSPFATALGLAAGCDAWAVDVFAEEVVRGGPLFAVSLALSAVEPGLRAAAELGAWQVISPGDATGRVVHVPGGLSEVQDLIYDEPTLLVVGEVTGEEEVPEGAVAVLTPDAPDVLSHVAVRARNLRVLFATCHDAGPLEELRAAAGKRLRVKTTAAGAVTWSEVAEEKAAAAAGGNGAASASDGGDLSEGRAPRLSIGKAPEWCGKWALQMPEFRDGVVGAKSKNLAAMRALPLPADVGLPPAVTVPFGAFERALEEPANAEVARELRAAVERVRELEARTGGGNRVAAGGNGSNGNGNGNGSNGNGNGSNGNGAAASAAAAAAAADPSAPAETVPAALARCRALAERVAVPPALRQELGLALQASGIPAPQNEERWRLAEAALRGVWASKYTDRAFLSLRRRGIDFDRDVRMAVCVMRVVPARYAFVLHTTNPSTGDEGEVFGELVKGLGEALVSGAVPGSSLAFAARKPTLGGGGGGKSGGKSGAFDKTAPLEGPAVLSYPSKSVGMFVPESLIFRSDSNGEDLEGYAGAGLYESITMDPPEISTVDYSSDPLTADPAFRQELLARVAASGWALEVALGSAQDVEGVVDPDGKVYIVQTRPQV